ncbi:capsular polysaccharide synthesis protein [Sphingobacterium sp. NPDC055431]
MKELRSFLMLVKCFLVNIKPRNILPDFVGEKILKISNREKDTVEEDFPKIIWMYWETYNLPSYVDKIVEHIKITNPNFVVNLLHSESIKEYLPDLNITGEMPIANKTDLIRLNLLYKYGGIWIDSTTIFNEDLSWVIELNAIESYDIIGYYKETSTINFNFPVIESWFLASKPRNKLIGMWLKVLSPLAMVGAENYFELMKNRRDYLEIKQNINRPEYLLVYLAQQIAMRECELFNLFLKKSEDSAFLLQESRGWNNYEINYALCRAPMKKPFIPIVKLTSGDRILIEMFYKYNLIRRKSILGLICFDK